MLSRILPQIPDHKLYCEPFFGGGAVFFAKEKAPTSVINDQNDNLMCFYRALQQRPQELQRMIKQTPHGRKAHRRAHIMLKYAHLFDEVERAWAVWTQTNMSFTSKIMGGFAYDRSGSTTRKIDNKKLHFDTELSEMLQGVCIECNDALKVIHTRDTIDSFFYCDPPYIGSEMGHYKGYSKGDFIDLLDTLSTIEGKFMLSMYPNTTLDNAAKKYGWNIQRYPKTVAVSHLVKKTSEEILVMNYDLKRAV